MEYLKEWLIEKGFDESDAEKMEKLSAELYEQFEKADQLETTIKQNLEVLGYGI